MKTFRWLALAAVLAGTATLVPATAGAGTTPSEIPYTCRETTPIVVGLPNIEVPLSISTVGSPDPARVFQPVTWTVDLAEPALVPPLTINLDHLIVRLAIPDNVAAVSAVAVAKPGETPNPALNQLDVEVVDDEVVVQLPANPTASNRIRAADALDGHGLTYPSNILSIGQPVVLPLIEMTGVPTPAAAGTTLIWPAARVETAGTFPVLGFGTLACEPTDEPFPSLFETTVLSTVQRCDGQPVTVQLGFNTPTQGADVIQGTPAADTTNGLGGNDRFCGLNGVDTFNGGAGNDRALGGAGNDKLRGDAGNDRLQGDAGNDNLQGGANNDTLLGGANTDTCNGGPQTDTATTCEVRQSIP